MASDDEAAAVDDGLPKELYCAGCDTVVDPDDVDEEQWYDCQNCGEEFNREMSENGDHRCPSCNKFASRSDTEHCAECQEPLDERPVGVTA